MLKFKLESGLGDTVTVTTSVCYPITFKICLFFGFGRRATHYFKWTKRESFYCVL